MDKLVCNALAENPSRHCAALVITLNVVEEDGWPRFVSKKVSGTFS